MRIAHRAAVQVAIRVALRVQIETLADLLCVAFHVDQVALLQVIGDQMLVQVAAVDVVGGDLLGRSIPSINRIIVLVRAVAHVVLVAFLVCLAFLVESRSISCASSMCNQFTVSRSLQSVSMPFDFQQSTVRWPRLPLFAGGICIKIFRVVRICPDNLVDLIVGFLHEITNQTIFERLVLVQQTIFLMIWHEVAVHLLQQIILDQLIVHLVIVRRIIVNRLVLNGALFVV